MRWELWVLHAEEDGNVLFDDNLRVEDLSNWIANINFLLALSLVIILKEFFSYSSLSYLAETPHSW